MVSGTCPLVPGYGLLGAREDAAGKSVNLPKTSWRKSGENKMFDRGLHLKTAFLPQPLPKETILTGNLMSCLKRVLNKVFDMMPQGMRPLSGRLILMGTLLMSTAATGYEATDAEGYEAPQLAYNLTAVRDWRPGLQFLDLVQMARPWSGSIDRVYNSYTTEMLVDGGYLDDQGWPTHIPSELESVEMSWAWKTPSDAVEDRAGTYVLRYEGEGTLKLKGQGFEILSQGEGEIVFQHTGVGHFGLHVVETDPAGTGDYIRDISIVREENVELYDAGAMFNPEWIELIKDASQIRFMDWQDTNNSTISSWDDRSMPGARTGNDIPLEYMVRLANEVGADPWFTIPHLADEEYIRNFATYVRDNLDPHLTARIEYSNEAWNWAFGQTKWMLKQSQEEWGVDNGWNDYYVKKSVEVALIFEEVFAETGAEDRLVNVLGTQAVNAKLTERLLAAKVWKQMEPENWVDPATVFEEVAVTTYFGDRAVANAELRAELLAVIEDPAVDAAAFLYEKLNDPDYPGSVPYYAARWALQAEVAEKAGLVLSAYEGGQHVHHTFAVKGLTDEEIGRLTSFMQEFVYSEEMAKLTEAAWDAWAAVSDSPFMQFGEVADSTPRASFGLRTSLGDDNPVALTLEALAAEASEAAGDGSATAYQHGVVVQGSDGDEVIVGTREEDYLIGKGGDDVFVAGEGDDGIHGGVGEDRVILSGAPGDYTLEADGKGYRLTGPEGSDYLVEIELLSFETGETLAIAEMLGRPAAEPVPDTGGVSNPEEPQPDPAEVTPPEEPQPDPVESTPPEDSQPDLIEEEEALEEEPAIPAEPIENAVFTGAGDLITGAETVTAQSAKGVIIQTLNRFAGTGKELGMTAESGRTYAITERGASALFDGVGVGANYYSLNDDKATANGPTLTGSALETALKLGSIYVNAGTVTGTAANDAFLGRESADVFDGGAGNDNMAGGGGDDILRGGTGNDKILGGAGVDTVLLSGGVGDYVITAEGNGYRLTGPDGSDFLVDVERLGFDTGETLTIAEMLAGPSAGPDTGGVTPPEEPDPVEVTPPEDPQPTPVEEEAQEEEPGTPADPANPTENVVFTGAGDLVTGAEMVTAQGAKGVTVQALNRSAATGKELGMTAESGKTYAITEKGASAPFDGVAVGANYYSLNDDKATANGPALTGSALETALKLGSIYVDAAAVTGTAASDAFYGRDAADVFDGGAGNDYMAGGGGDDILRGGAGDDTIHGGAGEDTVLLSGKADDYSLMASDTGGYRLSGADGNDLMMEVEKFVFDDGGSLTIEDLLRLTAARQEEAAPADVSRTIATSSGPMALLFADEVGPLGDLVDGAGKTVDVVSDAGMTISGMNRSSELGKQVGAGADTSYSIYETGKTASFGGRTEVEANYWSVEANRDSKNGAALSGSALETALKFGSVVLNASGIAGGAGNDLFFGRNGDDVFLGGAGNDTLSGGGGKDHLTGGTGNDVLLGGAGNDVFYFAKGSGKDVIQDFGRGDSLDLGDFLAEGDSPLDHLTQVKGGLMLSNGEDQILFAGLHMQDTGWVFG